VVTEWPDRGKIIVSGIAFWFPLAGVTYQFLHYMLGLRRLGFDVYYVEDSGRWIYDPRLNDISPDAGGNVAAVAEIFDAFGFRGRWAFRGNYPGGRCYGMEEAELLRLYREADALLNVTASQELRDEHLTIPRRIYVESDPFPAQVKASQGDEETLKMLAAHDSLFTFGENIGGDDCTLPTAGFEWLPTRQPVALDLWANDIDTHDAPFTTITTWHNKGKDLEFDGESYYWTKDREFVKYLAMPVRTGRPLELALGRDPDAEALLDANGWQHRDVIALSSDLDAYRGYIQHSRGEFTVARDQYTRPRTGWFSDRTACYLAAGRPVVTQETGFSKFLPTGEGLFGFSDFEEAAAAVATIDADYARHADAARQIASEYFSAEKVIGSLLDRAGL
jgi:hypothetical protein